LSGRRDAASGAVGGRRRTDSLPAFREAEARLDVGDPDVDGLARLRAGHEQGEVLDLRDAVALAAGVDDLDRQLVAGPTNR